MSFVGSLVRNLIGKPVAADFRDSAEHFVAVLRESGIKLSWDKDELRYIDALVERLGGHNEYRDAIGCYLGELVVRNFPGAEWMPSHALGPAVRVGGAGFAGDGRSPKGGASIVRHVFPLGWVYRRADGGPAESIAKKLHKELGFPEGNPGAFTDTGERA